jgi:uncharacterized delta-60 repeat protein
MYMRSYLLFLIVFMQSHVFAQSAGLDGTFATKGVLNINVKTIPAPTHIRLQADGKILVANTELNTINYKNTIVVRRLLPNGLPDLSFGTKGQMSFSYGTYEEAIGIEQLSNGKIQLVLAPVTYQDSKYSLIRLTAEGKMDSSFNDSGAVHVSNPTIMSLNSFGVQSSGKIIMAGDALAPSTLYYYLLRYKEEGEIDSAFGNDGILMLPVMIPGLAADIVLIQPDDKVLVAGTSFKSTSNQRRQITMTRSDDNGLDGSFGNGLGHITFDRPDMYAMSVSSMVQQNNGDIIVAGTISYRYEGANFNWVARLKADGTMDNSFGNNGYLELDSLPATHRVQPKVALQNDGKILVSYGEAGPKNVLRHTLRRLNADGNIDGTFFYNGRLAAVVVPDENNASALAVQPDGKILIAGKHYNSITTQGIYIARYWHNQNWSEVEDVFENKVIVYPNPVTETLIAEGLEQNTDIQLIDIAGREISNVKATKSKVVIDMKCVPSGTYLIQFSDTKGSTKTKTIIKQ